MAWLLAFIFLVLRAGCSGADLSLKTESRETLINGQLTILANYVIDKYFSKERCLSVVKEPGLLHGLEINNSAAILEINSTEDNCREVVENFYRRMAYEDKCTGYIVQLLNPDCGFLGWWDVYKRRYVPRHNPRFFFLPVYPGMLEYADDLFSLRQSDLSQNLLAAEIIEDNQSDWKVLFRTNNFYEHPLLEGREPSIYLGEWHHQRGFEEDINLYPDKILNLRGKPFRVATGKYLPFTVGVPFDGMENRIAIEFCTKHNCSPVPVEDDYIWGTMYEDNNTGNGVLGNVYGDSADLGTLAIYLWPIYCFYVDYTASYLYGDVTVMTPRPQRIGGWLVPFLPFKWDMWTAFGVSLVLSGASLYFITRISIKYTRFADELLAKVQFTTVEDSSLRAIGLAVLQTPSSRLIGDSPNRYLFTSFEFLYLVLSAMYSAELSSFLTVPLFYPPIDKFKEFSSSGITWLATHIAWSYALRGVPDEDAKTIVEHFRVYPMENLVQLAKVGSYALAIDRLPGGSITEQEHITETVIPNYHIMKEGLFGSPLVAAIKKGGPYNDYYDRVVNLIVEHGLSLFWEAEVARLYLNSRIQAEYNEAKTLVIDSTPSVIELGHIVGILYLYGIGIVISSVLFIFEKFRARSG